MNDFYSGYGFQAEPFRLTPDPGFRFAHDAYARASEALRRALLERRGIVMLTGKPGTGKTTLVGDLLSQIASERMKSAVLTSTQLDTDDLLRMIAQAFDLHSRSGDRAAIRTLIDQFLQRRAEAGQTTLLVVDEAQNLSADALETLRRLNGGDDGARPALDILLVGQEQLLEKLRRPELKRLSQRIVEAAHLGTLDADETRAYIEHRLTHAGWRGEPHLTEDAYQLIQLLSRGLPRYINKLCARLLVHGGIDGKAELDARDVLTVGREMRDELLVPRFADSELDDALERLSAEQRERTHQPSRSAAGTASARQGDSGAARPNATSIDRAYGPTEPESSAAANSTAETGATEPDAVQRGDATGHAADSGRPPPRPARTAPARALVAGILVLMVAVGYGIWRHHPQLWQLLASRSRTPVVTHQPTRASAARADGAVQRNDAPPSRSLVVPATGASAEVHSRSAPVGSPDNTKPNAAGPVRQAKTSSPPAAGLALTNEPDKARAAGAPPPDQSGTSSAPGAQPAPPASPRGAARHTGANPPTAGSRTKAPKDTPAPDNGGPPTANDESPQPPLSELAAKARAAFEDYRLTIPAVGSAYYYYQLMLARAPDDPRARRGLQRIVQRYLWLARRSLRRQDYDRTRNYIHRGLGVDPDNPDLLKLQSRLPSDRSATDGGGSEGTAPAKSAVPIPVTPAQSASP